MTEASRIDGGGAKASIAFPIIILTVAPEVAFAAKASQVTEFKTAVGIRLHNARREVDEIRVV